MSEATDQLARSRQAILAQVARRQRRHDPQMRTEQGYAADEPPGEPPPDPGAGWYPQVMHALRTWWRYHPAHMAVELAEPVLQGYARRKPLQLVGIAAATGAAFTLARPWKLISATTVLLALARSSQLSGVLLAALSAANFPRDAQQPPE